METGVGRIKRPNGGLLRSRTFGAQRKEVALQIAALNRMIRSAKPISVRVQ